MLFKRLFRSAADKPPAELINLRREIENTRANLELAMANFDQAVDPTMIDCYIYEVKAEQLRYEFLLKQAKQFDNLFPQSKADFEAVYGRMDYDSPKG